MCINMFSPDLLPIVIYTSWSAGCKVKSRNDNAQWDSARLKLEILMHGGPVQG